MRRFPFWSALLTSSLLAASAFAIDPEPATNAETAPTTANTADAQESNDATIAHDTAAQEPSPEQTYALTDEQIALNNQAVEAVNYRQFEKAEQLFKAMLQIQELNIIWMNLGRTYANQNKCPEAADAYAKVTTSLKSSDFPSDLIEANTIDFINDLKIKCTATLTLTCREDVSTIIVIDNGEERACTETPLLIIPGQHAVYARTNNEASVYHFDAKPGENTVLDVTLAPQDFIAEPPDEIAPLPELDPKLVERSDLFKKVGYALIGSGAALAIGGFTLAGLAYFDFQNHCGKGSLDDTCKEIDNSIWESPMGFREDKIKTYTAVGGVIGGLGAAALLTGVALIVVNAVVYQPQIDAFATSDPIQFSPVFSPQFAGFTLSTRF
ncbi:MAG: hypothetical protein IKY83_10825 [Proteobacteria bacterium]|nr:hypothetical protein [Pseudomonadota bacterium]